MEAQPLPNEPARLQALHEYEILDTDAEAEFDDFTLLAAQICGMPISLISLIDANRQWVKSAAGIRVGEVPRSQTFCTHALHQPEILLVPDTQADARFQDNPFVTGDPNIRFYAGAPLITAEGHALGMLCVLDRVPRSLTPAQQKALQALSRQVVARLELRRQLRAREKADRARETSETLKNAILQSALDCIVTINQQCKVVEWNPAAEQAFGYLREDVIGRDLTDLIIPQRFQDAHRGGMAHFLATGEGPVLHQRIEIEARRSDGAEFPVELAITPIALESETLFTAYLRDITSRKHAEAALKTAHEELEARVAQRTEALAQAQRRNELLLNSAGEGIYGLDTDGITQFVNPAAAKMLGYTREELIGQSMHALLHHTHADGRAFPKQDCPVVRCLHDARIRRVDDEVFWRKDGTAFNVEYISTPICEDGKCENGKVLGAVVTFQDITERRQTAEALRLRTLELSAALQEHQNIIATVPDILFRLDTAGRLVQWNRKMETVTGLSPQELQDLPALSLFGPEDRGPIAEAIRRAFETGHAVVEGGLLDRSGCPALHQFSGVPLRGLDGGVIGLTGMGRDITEQRRTEEALRESEARYRGLVEHSPEAIIVYVESHLVYANAAAVTLFAASSAEDLVGQSILDFVHPDFHTLARERADRSQILGETSHLAQQKYVRLDGKVIDVEAVSTGIVYQGQPAGQVLIRDITERKRAEEDILALNAELLHAYDATIEGWSRALDLRDHETEGHSRRVTEMTLRLAQAVGIPEADIVHIRRGALLHDIGKMGVPDRVLLKPGPLDNAEWETMRRHPALAKEMLDPAEFLRPALTIPYCHHEKWDGTGYPQGLCGDEIPLAARLFALVDVWDALSSDRPYRAAWPGERVKDHLHRLAGTHFDPELATVFLGLLDESSAVEAHDLSRAA